MTGYRLYRNGSTTPLATSPTATFPDTTVAPSTTYAYQVTAVDAAGNESPRSNVASATTPSGPLVVTFAPTDDATIDSSLPTSLFGANVRLTVDNSPVVHSLLKFNVSGLPACSVTSAVLRLTVGSATDDKSVYGGDVYATSSSAWSETTVNWNNGPTSSGAKLSSVAGAVGLNTTYQWDCQAAGGGRRCRERGPEDHEQRRRPVLLEGRRHPRPGATAGGDLLTGGGRQGTVVVSAGGCGTGGWGTGSPSWVRGASRRATASAFMVACSTSSMRFGTLSAVSSDMPLARA